MLLLLQRLGVAIGNRCALHRGGPAYGIGNDALHLSVVVGGRCLMARTEIKKPALSTRVTTSAAEDFSPTKPACQDQRFGLRDIKVLPVHLLVIQFDILSKASRNGMARLHNPQAFMIVALAP